MKVLSNGEFVRALFEVHLKHIVYVYPGMYEFEALMLQGVVAYVTVTFETSSAKTPVPQGVSSYEHAKMHPAIGVNVKKSVF